MSADQIVELTQYNTMAPMTNALFDETYIRKLISNVNVGREDIREIVRGIYSNLTFYAGKVTFFA